MNKPFILKDNQRCVVQLDRERMQDIAAKAAIIPPKVCETKAVVIFGKIACVHIGRFQFLNADDFDVVISEERLSK